MRGLVIALTVVAPSALHADGLDDMFGPRELAVGEAMRGGATGASAIGLNPAGLPLNRELVFEGGYGYRASDAASMLGVSACDSTNAAPGCFFYYYAASSPELDGMTGARDAHIGGLAMARPFLPRVMLGATTKYYDFDSTMTGETSARGVAFDIGTTIRFSESINLGIAAQNLWASSETEHLPRTIGGGVQLRPLPSLTLSFDARWRLEGEDRAARFGGGIEWFLRVKNSALPLRVGAVHDGNRDASFVSGGLGYAAMKWGVDVGARRQLANGEELLVIASLRLFGPRMAVPTLATQPGFAGQ